MFRKAIFWHAELLSLCVLGTAVPVPLSAQTVAWYQHEIASLNAHIGQAQMRYAHYQTALGQAQWHYQEEAKNIANLTWQQAHAHPNQRGSIQTHINAAHGRQQQAGMQIAQITGLMRQEEAAVVGLLHSRNVAQHNLQRLLETPPPVRVFVPPVPRPAPLPAEPHRPAPAPVPASERHDKRPVQLASLKPTVDHPAPFPSPKPAKTAPKTTPLAVLPPTVTSPKAAPNTTPVAVLPPPVTSANPPQPSPAVASGLVPQPDTLVKGNVRVPNPPLFPAPSAGGANQFSTSISVSEWTDSLTMSFQQPDTLINQPPIWQPDTVINQPAVFQPDTVIPGIGGTPDVRIPNAPMQQPAIRIPNAPQQQAPIRIPNPPLVVSIPLADLGLPQPAARIEQVMYTATRFGQPTESQVFAVIYYDGMAPTFLQFSADHAMMRQMGVNGYATVLANQIQNSLAMLN